MNGYTKLFGSIIASTIWSEDDRTRIVWITMLAMADQHGEVQASVPGLAKMASVPLEATEAALAKLSAPDAYSRTKDFDGRRIQAIDGGWLILNHAKYRAKSDVDDRREQARERAARYRARHAGVTLCNATSRSVTPGDEISRQAEAEAEAEAVQYPPSPPPTRNDSSVSVTKQSAGGRSPVETGAEEREVEPPKGFPKTAEEAKAAAFVIGCPAQFAVKTWEKAMSRAGRDSRDIPIRRWSAYLATEWRYEQERLSRTSATVLSGEQAQRKASAAIAAKINAELERM